MKPFPYRNVVSLSAAHEYEAAQDIPASMLSEYPTIDGKPHGAFTDSLVRVLSSHNIKNSGNNAVITLGALFESVKKLMKDKKYSSTPKMLPQAKEALDLSARALFGSR